MLASRPYLPYPQDGPVWGSCASLRGLNLSSLLVGSQTMHPSFRSGLKKLAALSVLGFATASGFAQEPARADWKKTQLDPVFNSEGVTTADVNKDGKIDVITGENWYEAPTWKKHEIRKNGNYGDGLKSYSNSFACWADDVNKDGWADVIVIGFPGAPCHWFENPQGKDGHWTQHELWISACNETPLCADLFGNGKKVVVMGSQPKGKETEGQMAWFTPSSDPNALWEMHAISEASAPGKEIPGTRKFSHGLGVGDVNKDGRNDVICTDGWWEQPVEGQKATKPWTFHPAKLGEACADLVVVDVDGDGLNDIISSSAHKYGIWWHKQRPDGSFTRMDLFPKLVSETHALALVDLDRDGTADFVSGKRWWSHGRSEPGSEQNPAIYLFKGSRNSDGLLQFTPIILADGCGVGTQFQVADLNGDGKLDIISSNKKGVHIAIQP